MIIRQRLAEMTTLLSHAATVRVLLVLMVVAVGATAFIYSIYGSDVLYIGYDFIFKDVNGRPDYFPFIWICSALGLLLGVRNGFQTTLLAGLLVVALLCRVSVNYLAMYGGLAFL